MYGVTANAVPCSNQSFRTHLGEWGINFQDERDDHWLLLRTDLYRLGSCFSCEHMHSPFE